MIKRRNIRIFFLASHFQLDCLENLLYYMAFILSPFLHLIFSRSSDVEDIIITKIVLSFMLLGFGCVYG